MKKQINFSQLEQEAEYYAYISQQRIKDHTEGKETFSTSQGLKENLNKFEGIQKIVKSLGDILPLGGDPIAFLDKQIDNLEKKWTDKVSNDEAYKLEKDIKLFEQTREFIINQTKQPKSSVPFSEWKRKKEEIVRKKAEQIQQETQKPPNDNNLDTQTEEKIEKIKEQLLIDEIKNSGGCALYTSLPKEYSTRKFDGFQPKFDNKRIGLANTNFDRFVLHNFDQTLGYNSDKVLQERGFHDAVAITPMEQDVYTSVEKNIEKKRLGFIPVKNTEIVKEKTGTKPILHADVVTGGKPNEQAYKISYLVMQDNFASSEKGYKDYSGRNGNFFAVEFIVPKTTAEDFSEHLKDNPAFIRKLAKTLVVDNLGIPEEAWENGDDKTRGHPMRPPYELWDKQTNGGKIYIQETDSSGNFISEELNIKDSKTY